MEGTSQATNRRLARVTVQYSAVLCGENSHISQAPKR
jgi:hypothetical protein